MVNSFKIVKFLFCLVLVSLLSSCGLFSQSDDSNSNQTIEESIESTQSLRSATTTGGASVKRKVCIWMCEKLGKVYKCIRPGSKSPLPARKDIPDTVVKKAIKSARSGIVDHSYKAGKALEEEGCFDAGMCKALMNSYGPNGTIHMPDIQDILEACKEATVKEVK